jgi:hypothetical protein
MLVLDAAQTSEGDVLLNDMDFPPEWKHMSHPDDFIISDHPIEPEFFVFDKNGVHHTRLLLRISFQTSENKFFPISFVVDTGAPLGLYLSPQAEKVFRENKIIRDGDSDTVDIYGKQFLLGFTPTNHQPANILGLRAILHLGGITVGNMDDKGRRKLSFGKGPVEYF